MVNNNFTRYSSREGKIVQEWINSTRWLLNEVEKVEPDNTGFHDYKIWLKDGGIITVEVKEEEYYWYGKTGNIGLDFISAFHFRSREIERHWKNIRNYWVSASDIGFFLNDNIEVSKWGKLITCDADIQLFYVENKSKIVFLQPYCNYRLQSKIFIEYLKRNYDLRINKKSDYNLRDDWESAAFFVKPEDKMLTKCEINSLAELKKCSRDE